MHILDRSFVYTPAAKTDIRRTFEKARQQLGKSTNRHAITAQLYFPIPESVSEQEFAESMRLMHQDLDQDYPWGN